MSKRNRYLVATGILGLVAGCGAVAYAALRTPPTTPPPAPATLLRAVRVQEVTADAAAVEQTYTGVVRARYETDLAFRVGAKIVSRHVEVGQRVAAGAVLFRLEPTDYRLTVNAAEADFSAQSLGSLELKLVARGLGKLSIVANSLVLSDVPDNTTIVGVPARIRLPGGQPRRFQKVATPN